MLRFVLLFSFLFVCAQSFDSSASPKDYFSPKNPKQYARDLPFQPKHLELKLRLDLTTRSVSGLAIHHVQSNVKELDEVVLDAAELQIKGVLQGDKKCNFRQKGNQLKITLHQKVKLGEKTVLTIDYSATPRHGLYFVLPTQQFPDKPVAIFSQGETSGHQYWFPCFESTNARFTSETTFTVPKEYEVISNGVLVGTQEKDGWKSVHHKMNKTHVNYLLSVVVGKFSLATMKWKNVPILNYVPIVDKEKSHRTFQNTPDMMEFFSKNIGVDYPYSKYAQVVVYDFTGGGMENISATTLTHRTLHDKKAHLDFKSDGLIAHELAHQWFGDLLTCKDWSHIWLNESFATYFEQLYIEHKWGKEDLDEDRTYAIGWYFWETGSQYKRAIVTKRYQIDGDVFDSHAYPKGAAVLHMIRKKLGDELWWKTIQYYVKKHSYQLVTTEDFRRAIEKISHQNWEPFFDQWIFSAGHPVLDVKSQYNAKNKTFTLTVLQTQKERLFSFDLEVIVGHKNNPQKKVFSVSKKKHDFVFTTQLEPLFVEVDPDRVLLATIQQKQAVQEWHQQATHAKGIRSKLDALKHLGDFVNHPSTYSLFDQILSNPSQHRIYGRMVAKSLGQLKTAQACQLLLKHHKHSLSAVRSQIVNSLQDCDAQKAFVVAKEALEVDESYVVKAKAIQVLKEIQDEASYLLIQKALLKETGWHGYVQGQAMRALIEFEKKETLDLFVKVLQTTKHEKVVGSALMNIAKLVKRLHIQNKKKWVRLFRPYLKHPNGRIVGRAIQAFIALEAQEAIPYLQPYTQSAVTEDIRRTFREAIQKIRKANLSKKDTKAFTSLLKKLKKENKKILERLQKLEAKKIPKKATPSSKPTR